MSFRLAQTPSSKNNVYVCCEMLKGHIRAVISLGVTDDGKLLASGGKLQNRQSELSIDEPSIFRNRRHPGLGTRKSVFALKSQQPGYSGGHNRNRVDKESQRPRRSALLRNAGGVPCVLATRRGKVILQHFFWFWGGRATGGS